MSRENPAERWRMNMNEALMPLENSFPEEVVEGVKEIFNAYEKGATR
jgi:hypothetical protein